MRRLSLAPALGIALLVGAVIAALFALRAHRRGVARELARGRVLHGTPFAGADACAGCHPDHLASWRRTFHRTMTQDVSPAHPEAVAGDFSGVVYQYDGVEARMDRDRAGRPTMTFSRAGVSGAPVTATVVRTVGSRRYQQYLADVGGVLWRLPMAFHIEEKRWFHMNGAFLTPDPPPPAAFAGAAEVTTAIQPPPAPPRFGGGAFDRHVTRWNDNCVFCHNVAPNPGLDAASGIFRTTVAELGIACEACHGPGAEHVAVNHDPVRRYALHLSSVPDPTIVNPARLSPARAADLCGRCHGQRLSDDIAPVLAHGDPFVPGDDLALYSAPLWRDTPLGEAGHPFATRFWDDGTPRLTAYEYQGLLQSPCAIRGALTCTSCHGMHDGPPRGQLRPTAAADGACTGCHAPLAIPAAAARHSHHAAEGPGARCVSCHMPRIVYGVLDTHPSHRIELPDPARAIAMGRPDACTLCHVDSDRAWAVRAYRRLWPARTPAANTAPPEEVPLDDLLAPRDALFGGDPIARAVAADALGRAPWPPVLAERTRAERTRIGALLDALASDRYPAVRHLAARALQRVLAARDGGLAATVGEFDPTASPAMRQAVLSSLRRRLPAVGPAERARITALRERARAVDIDIGE